MERRAYDVARSLSEVADVHAVYSPETLRCIMAYIVDLTLVMEQLFLCTLPIRPPRLLSAEQIEMAVENYKTSGAPEVHRQIRGYVKKSTFMQILQLNNAQEKVIDLIRQNRADNPNL